MQISPKFSDTSFGANPTIDQKINVFEDRVLGWQLDIAELIRKKIEKAERGSPWQHAAFGLMNCLVSYFEMIAQYQQGESSSGQSAEFFRHGVKDVFPNTFNPEEINAIYSGVRCGLYHNAMTRRGVELSGEFSDALKSEMDDNGSIVARINPHKLSPVLLDHFKEYVAKLRDEGNTSERANFERFFDQNG